MAFGVICNTLLVAVLGVPPATASARIHVVEIFTSGVSGLSHVFHRNIDWPLLFSSLSHRLCRRRRLGARLHRPDRLAEPRLCKIGRASWRDRVCQYG